MTTTKNDRSADKADDKTPASQADAPGNAEVQEKFDEAAEKGYIGFSPSGGGAQGHDILSGPDAPPLIVDNRSRTEQHVLPAAEKKEGDRA
jgi:hypothetical protein